MTNTVRSDVQRHQIVLEHDMRRYTHVDIASPRDMDELLTIETASHLRHTRQIWILLI